MAGMKRTFYVQDGLWRQLQQAAADMGAIEGKPISISEIIRRALVAWLEREEERAA